MRSLCLILLLSVSVFTPYVSGDPSPGDTLVWMTGNLGVVRDLSWSPDGRRVAAATDGGLFILNSSTGDAVRFLELPKPLSVDWCSLGMLGVVTSRSILILSESGEEIARVSLRGEVDEALVQWSPDCELLAAGTSKLIAGGSSGSLALLTNQGGVRVLTELEAGVSSLRWSPEGDLLAVGLDNGRLLAFSREGRQLWTARAGLALTYGDALLSLAWSPDSSKLVAGLASSVVVCFESGGRELWRSSLLGPPVASLDWSHGGIAAASGGRVLMLNTSGREVWSTPDYGKTIEEVRWDSDGDRLAILSYRWMILVSPRGDLLWSTGLLPESALTMDWSPTDGAVAVGGSFGVAVFIVSPVEILAPPSVTIVRGHLDLELALQNLAPASVEADLRVRLDGALVEEVRLSLPPGESRVNVTVDVPPGEHELEFECESPSGVSTASTRVTSIEPLEVTIWATHSPGSPVDLVAAITNTNPLTLSVQVVVYDRDVEVARLPTDLSPGLKYANFSLSLEPGVHTLEVDVVGPTGTVLAKDAVSVPVIGPSVPLTLEAPSGFKLGAAEVQVRVENPYPLVLNVTLEVWVDSSLAYRESLSLAEGETRGVTLTLPTGRHTVLARASSAGFILAEQSVEASTIPMWLVAAVAGAVLLLVAAILSRARSRASKG